MKTVWITGASGGLGEALALKYAKEGWRVIASARSEDALQALAQQHAGIKPCALDVTAKQGLQARLKEYTDQVDIVIANAGTAEYVDIDAFDSTLFERQFELNVLGVIRTIEAALPMMPSGSQIAIVSSLATELPFTRAQAYGGSKAALDYIAKSLRTDLLSKQIDINLIKPGFIKTPLTDKNDFDMPFLITSKDAASRVYKAILKNKAEFRFPKRMSVLLRVLSCLPDRLLSQKLASQGGVK